jgi:hypothetical protein
MEVKIKNEEGIKNAIKNMVKPCILMSMDDFESFKKGLEKEKGLSAPVIKTFMGTPIEGRKWLESGKIYIVDMNDQPDDI